MYSCARVLGPGVNPTLNNKLLSRRSLKRLFHNYKLFLGTQGLLYGRGWVPGLGGCKFLLIEVSPKYNKFYCKTLNWHHAVLIFIANLNINLLGWIGMISPLSFSLNFNFCLKVSILWHITVNFSSVSRNHPSRMISIRAFAHH